MTGADHSKSTVGWPNAIFLNGEENLVKAKAFGERLN